MAPRPIDLSVRFGEIEGHEFEEGVLKHLFPGAVVGVAGVLSVVNIHRKNTSFRTIFVMSHFNRTASGDLEKFSFSARFVDSW